MGFTAKQQAAMYWARRQRLARQGGAAPPVIAQAETDALLARMSVQPNAARKTLIDNLIISLKNAGIWADLDALWIMAAHDAQAANLNWKSGSFTLVPMLVPLYTIDRGYDFDGTTQYIKTGFIPATGGVNFTLNSASVFIWCRENVASANAINALGTQGGSSTNKLWINPRRITTETYQFAVNQSAAAASLGTPTTAIGLTHAERSTSTLTTLYKNGVNIITDPTVSAGMSILELYLGATNLNGAAGSFDNRQLAVAGAGKALGDTKALQLYNALNTYLGAIGAA